MSTRKTADKAAGLASLPRLQWVADIAQKPGRPRLVCDAASKADRAPLALADPQTASPS